LSDQDAFSQNNSKQKLQSMKFVQLKSILDSRKEGLFDFFETFNKDSEKYFLKNLLDETESSDSDVQNKVNDLPLHLKSLLLKSVPEFASQINFDLQGERTNTLFYPKVKVLFNLLKKIEYLSSNENNQEVWTLLTELEINKLKANKNFNYVICRLSNYNNEILSQDGKNISREIRQQLEMPIYNEYFLINLENVPVQTETPDLNASFDTYSYKTEFTNTFEPVKNSMYDKVLINSLNLE
jgi:hypothetical protein